MDNAPRWLTLIIFVLSVAVPSGMANMAGGEGHSHPAAHHGHGAPADNPTDHGAGGCGDCGQPAFCCSHVSIAPLGATQGHALGGYIIVIAPQQVAVSAPAGLPYHPPRA